MYPPSRHASRALCADELEGRTPLKEYTGKHALPSGNVFTEDELETSDMIRDLVGGVELLVLFIFVRADVLVTEGDSGMFGCFHGWV